MKGTVRDRQKQGEELGDLPALFAKGDQGVSDEETLAVPAAHEHLHRLRPPRGIGDHGGAAVVLDDAPRHKGAANRKIPALLFKDIASRIAKKHFRLPVPVQDGVVRAKEVAPERDVIQDAR